MEQLGEDVEGLLTGEVEAAQNTNKDKIARHQKRLKHGYDTMLEILNEQYYISQVIKYT